MTANSHSLLLGPFQGITDVHYRRLYRKYFSGIDVFYTPFFTGTVRLSGLGKPPEDIDPQLNDVATTLPQILSKDASEIVQFSKVCHELGYPAINWNLGCPYPRVANKKRGSGLLPYPEDITLILNQLKENLACGLSIKCRLGWQSTDEIFTLAPLFNAFPLTEVIVHARIGKQLYKGKVHEEVFARLNNQLSAPLAYNGDIFSVSDFQYFTNIFPETRRWMLGRGLLANPFLAAEIQQNCLFSSQQKQSIVQAFTSELYEFRMKNANGNLSFLGRMKEIWSYMVWSFNDPLTAWRLLRKARSKEEYESASNEIFSTLQWTGSGFSADRSW